MADWFLPQVFIMVYELEAVAVIPYHRIEKMVWYSGGSMYTSHESSTTHSQTGLKSDLGEEYEETSTKKNIVDNVEQYMIIKKKKTITRVEDAGPNNNSTTTNAAPSPNNGAVRYKAVETVKTSTTSFAGNNRLAIYAVWRGKPRVYLIDSKHGIYGAYVLDFFKILVKKGIPFEVAIDDTSDLLKRKKQYLEEYFSLETGHTNKGNR